MSEVQTTPNIGEVFVTFISKDVVIVDPFLGQLDRDHQVMTWRLASDVPGVEFAEVDGITFPGAVPQGFTPWPGDKPTGDARTYTANVRFQVPHGEPAQKYRYLIALDTPGGRIIVDQVRSAQANELVDPDIENRPQP
ncbi:MAG TPA: hypothetical protein VGF28_14760 [Thermoanaerobaculia bacterium]|jgi:hypothetical protein